MKRLLILLFSILCGFCMAQDRIPAKNDTLYFEHTKYYVPKYDVKINYLDSLGNVVDIKKCPVGLYTKQYVGQDFVLVEFYYKSDAYESKKKRKGKKGESKTYTAVLRSLE